MSATALTLTGACVVISNAAEDNVKLLMSQLTWRTSVSEGDPELDSSPVGVFLEGSAPGGG